MNLLLDTQCVLWFWWDDPQLSATAKALIRDPANRKLVSFATPWEVAIKISRKKLDIGGPFVGFFDQHMIRTNFDWLATTTKQLELVSTLPFHHNDPFDQLIISQALRESIPVISIDTQFDAYGVTRLW